MGKIVRISGDVVYIGLENGELAEVPVESLNYEFPQVGDDVKIYRSDKKIIVERWCVLHRRRSMSMCMPMCIRAENEELTSMSLSG